MGRWDYTEAFPLGNRKLNVVICIYQKMGYSRKNRINEMLEAIQTDLKKKLTCYEKVQTAYVYEAPLLTVKKFEKLTEETPVKEKKYIVWLMLCLWDWHCWNNCRI